MGVLREQKALAPQVDHALYFILSFRCSCDKVFLLYRHGCPGMCYVDQVGLDHTEIKLPLLPKLKDQKCTPPHLALALYFKYIEFESLL